MPGSTHPRCAILDTLDALGNLWSLGILRCVFFGQNRYNQIQTELGISTNVLAARLNALVEGGILERKPYQVRPLRHEYVLTAKGADLGPALVALRDWGRHHLDGDLGPLTHRSCGGDVTAQVRCDRCGDTVEASQVVSADALASSG